MFELIKLLNTLSSNNKSSIINKPIMVGIMPDILWHEMV